MRLDGRTKRIHHIYLIDIPHLLESFPDMLHGILRKVVDLLAAVEEHLAQCHELHLLLLIHVVIADASPATGCIGNQNPVHVLAATTISLKLHKQSPGQDLQGTPPQSIAHHELLLEFLDLAFVTLHLQ